MTSTLQTPIVNWPAPYIPNLPLQGMPTRLFDNLINQYGVRLGWMQGHECPCSWGYEVPGSPDPNCNTCNGRGYYWDTWNCTFNGLITYMHTAAAPDEPGIIVDPTYGQIQRSEPTLTIPYSASTVWSYASTMDAYVEVDAVSRFNTILVQGTNSVLPYQQQLSILQVTIYNPDTHAVTTALSSQYVVSGAAITLVGFPNGTAYMVEYNASPVYLAWRSAGGLPHTRPFAAGTGQIPKRFRLVALDVWTRARNNGGLTNLDTNNGFIMETSSGDEIGAGDGLNTSTSPQAIS